MRTTNSWLDEEARRLYMTIADVAELCHTSPATVYQWRTGQRHGFPPGHKVGRRVLFDRAAVLTWLANRPDHH